MAESGGLENRCTRKGTVGSNPTLSAIPFPAEVEGFQSFWIRFYQDEPMHHRLPLGDGQCRGWRNGVGSMREKLNRLSGVIVD